MNSRIPSRLAFPASFVREPAAPSVAAAAPAPVNEPPGRPSPFSSFEDGPGRTMRGKPDGLGGLGGVDPAPGTSVAQSSAWSDGTHPQVDVTTLGDSVATGQASGLHDGFNERVSAVSLGDPTRSQWSNGGTPLLQQRGNADCGETVAAMLKGAKDGAGSVAGDNAQHVINDYARRFSHGDGTTPRELGDMLASEGILVKRSNNTLDADALSSALRNGDKGVVMLDSSKLSGDSPQANGQAHWVLVDGIDERGNFLVKDPASGSQFSLSPRELEAAIHTSQTARQSGGMLIVGIPGAGGATLGGLNELGSDVLGHAPGTGSNWRRNSRESAEW